MRKDINREGGAWQLAAGTNAEKAESDQIVRAEEIQASIVAVIATAADKARSENLQTLSRDSVKSY